MVFAIFPVPFHSPFFFFFLLVTIRRGNVNLDFWSWTLKLFIWLYYTHASQAGFELKLCKIQTFCLLNVWKQYTSILLCMSIWPVYLSSLLIMLQPWGYRLYRDAFAAIDEQTEKLFSIITCTIKKFPPIPLSMWFHSVWRLCEGAATRGKPWEEKKWQLGVELLEHLQSLSRHYPFPCINCNSLLKLINMPLLLRRHMAVRFPDSHYSSLWAQQRKQ